MEKAQCFDCGTERKLQSFRYVVTDAGISGSTYYACNTECLLEVANSEREFSNAEDYLTTGEAGEAQED